MLDVALGCEIQEWGVGIWIRGGCGMGDGKMEHRWDGLGTDMGWTWEELGWIGDEVWIWDGIGMIMAWDKYMGWTGDGSGLRIWDGHGYGGGDGDRMWGYGYGMGLRWQWGGSDGHGMG